MRLRLDCKHSRGNAIIESDYKEAKGGFNGISLGYIWRRLTN